MNEAASYTCPACGLTSYNPNDVEQRYCGHCHVFEHPDAAFQRLLDASSLGTPGAKALIARSTPEDVARVRAALEILIALTDVAAEMDDDEALPHPPLGMNNPRNRGDL